MAYAGMDLPAMECHSSALLQIMALHAIEIRTRPRTRGARRVQVAARHRHHGPQQASQAALQACTWMGLPAMEYHSAALFQIKALHVISITMRPRTRGALGV